jgi:cell division protein FtsL
MAHVVVRDRATVWSVERPAPRDRSSLYRYLLLVTAFLVLGLLFAWVRLEAIKMGYEISSLSEQAAQLASGNEKLRMEVATLHSSSRITRLAQEKLGLVRPAQNQIVILP